MDNNLEQIPGHLYLDGKNIGLITSLEVDVNVFNVEKYKGTYLSPSGINETITVNMYRKLSVWNKIKRLIKGEYK